MNWKNILAEIFETGLTQAECAALWSVGQATVSDISTGKTKDPRGSLCMVILATHTERTAKKPQHDVVVCAGDALGYVGDGIAPKCAV